MVKYVRREIRSLSDEDRERFLDAAETLYRVPSEQGQALYGDKYKGIEYFVQMHLDGAGVPDCDHWHDGAGIMTHHVGFTLEFEQALQVVDPLVTVPYWEYTLDEQLFHSLGESPIFEDDWFGEISPDNDFKAVESGRWAYTPVATADASYGVKNPWGLLRSPWNTNPAPYFSRSDQVAGGQGFFIPSCETYSSCFYRPSLAGVNNCLNGATHGPVHILIGGEWGHPNQALIQEWGISAKLVLIAKALWRRGFLRVPETCEGYNDDGSATGANACHTSCPAEIYEAHGMTPYDVLVQSTLLDGRLYGGKIYYDDEADAYHVRGSEDDPEAEAYAWEHLLAVYCNPGMVGEMFTSSAPVRSYLLGASPHRGAVAGQRRMAAEREGDDAIPWDEAWGYKHHEGDTGDMEVVCDWSGVVDETDLPICEEMECSGHLQFDPLPFKFLLDGEVVEMDNQELYDFVHPENPQVPYMYDTFSWPHCDAAGYPLG